MFRYKRIIGDPLRAQHCESQKKEDPQFGRYQGGSQLWSSEEYIDRAMHLLSKRNCLGGHRHNRPVHAACLPRLLLQMCQYTLVGFHADSESMGLDEEIHHPPYLQPRKQVSLMGP